MNSNLKTGYMTYAGAKKRKKAFAKGIALIEKTISISSASLSSGVHGALVDTLLLWGYRWEPRTKFQSWPRSSQRKWAQHTHWSSLHFQKARSWLFTTVFWLDSISLKTLVIPPLPIRMHVQQVTQPPSLDHSSQPIYRCVYPTQACLRFYLHSGQPKFKNPLFTFSTANMDMGESQISDQIKSELIRDE